MKNSNAKCSGINRIELSRFEPYFVLLTGGTIEDAYRAVAPRVGDRVNSDIAPTMAVRQSARWTVPALRRTVRVTDRVNS